MTPPDNESVARTALQAAAGLHEPVLLNEVLRVLAPKRGGLFVDGTFGAGGYTRAILAVEGTSVLGLDQDPEAIARGQVWAPLYGERLRLVEARFSDLDAVVREGGEAPAGIVLDIGVSSMQIDEARRGFSFAKDGPLDMRMAAGESADKPSVADLVATISQDALTDILFHFGEERASRRIAKAIVAARAEAPIATTGQLAAIVERCLPRPKPGQPHAATRSFQALRIAVNDELGELVEALAAAERVLPPGGVLAVVTFHSLEDRIVKRFFQERSGAGPQGSRHQPQINLAEPTFELVMRGAIAPGEAEIARNPRARSAKLRAGRRLGGTARALDRRALGVPPLDVERVLGSRR